MKRYLFRFGLVCLLLSTVLAGCKKEIIPGPGVLPLNAEDLADILQNKLKNNCVGYAFTIHYKQNPTVFRGGGEARRPQDPPATTMDAFSRFSVASVSKTVTAAALMRLLYENPNVSVNSLIWPFLPSHWTLGNGINTITFKELLTHTSGFRNSTTDNDYAGLKSFIAAGINMNDKNVAEYNNQNYGILRLIIPELAGYSIQQVSSSFDIFGEQIQENQLATSYKDYCRKKVFEKAGIPNMDCKTGPGNPPLYYAFPKDGQQGFDEGDLTMHSGGQGWVMNAIEMGQFFHALHFTQNILPTSVSEQMKNQKLGYDVVDFTNDGVKYYWKNGIYNIGNSNRGYRSVIIGFENDIQIAAHVNSPMNLVGTVISAFEEWYK